MPPRAAARFATVEYAIRDVLGPARALEAQGHKVLRLNIGDPCKFDFEPPAALREGLARHTGKAWYGESEGETALREAIARYEASRGVRVRGEDVLVTSGVSEALQFLLGAVLEPGDEVLIPGPTYPPYVSVPRMFGGVPVEYPTPADSWVPDPEAVRALVTPRTKALVVISPNNPTGVTVPKKTLEGLARVAAEHDLLLIADEIYAELWFDAAPPSMATATSYPLVVVNGFSKAWLVPGWRMGYVAFRDPEGKLADVREAVLKQARLRLSPPLPQQLALADALRPDAAHFAGLRERIRRRARLVAERVRESPHLDLVDPTGAFYAFVRVKDLGKRTDKQWVLDLLHEEKVLTVHGSGFGKTGTGHFRVVVLPDEATLGEAMDRVVRFAKKTAP